MREDRRTDEENAHTALHRMRWPSQASRKQTAQRIDKRKQCDDNDYGSPTRRDKTSSSNTEEKSNGNREEKKKKGDMQARMRFGIERRKKGV